MLASGPEFFGNVLVDPSAKIGSGCLVGPDVVIGPDCVVENGVCLKRTTLLPRSKVRSHSWISDSIVGWDSVVGEWVRMESTSVLGEDVTIKSEVYLNGAVVLPHKSVGEDIPEAKIVM